MVHPFASTRTAILLELTGMISAPAIYTGTEVDVIYVVGTSDFDTFRHLVFAQQGTSAQHLTRLRCQREEFRSS